VINKYEIRSLCCDGSFGRSTLRGVGRIASYEKIPVKRGLTPSVRCKEVSQGLRSKGTETTVMGVNASHIDEGVKTRRQA